MQYTEQTPFSLDWMHPTHPEWGLEIVWYDTAYSEQYSAFWVHINKGTITNNPKCFTFSGETLPKLPDKVLNLNISQWHLEKNNEGEIELRFKNGITEYVILSINMEKQKFTFTSSLVYRTDKNKEE